MRGVSVTSACSRMCLPPHGRGLTMNRVARASQAVLGRQAEPSGSKQGRLEAYAQRLAPASGAAAASQQHPLADALEALSYPDWQLGPGRHRPQSTAVPQQARSSCALRSTCTCAMSQGAARG
jgi:hypothetical protein